MNSILLQVDRIDDDTIVFSEKEKWVNIKINPLIVDLGLLILETNKLVSTVTTTNFVTLIQEKYVDEHENKKIVEKNEKPCFGISLDNSESSKALILNPETIYQIDILQTIKLLWYLKEYPDSTIQELLVNNLDRCNVKQLLYQTIEKKEAEDFFKWYLKGASNSSNLLYYYIVSWCYEYGFGVEKDNSKSLDWLIKAAQGGDGLGAAVNALGLLYLYGTGIKKDLKIAFSYFKKAVEKGHPGAFNSIAWCYETGSGTNIDYKEAAKNYQLSAQLNHPLGQFNLGLCYSEGKGFEKNVPEAFKHFKLSADQGNRHAQYRIGLSYQFGMGVTMDNYSSFNYFKKSAKQGCRLAQYSVGTCYEYGSGVNQNYESAKKWYKKSADQKYDCAIKSLQQLEKK